MRPRPSVPTAVRAAVLACAAALGALGACGGDAPPAAAPAGAHPAWFDGGFEEALTQARITNRLVFVDFWTDWCVWCKRLDARTFADPDVRAELATLVPLSLDAESPAGVPVARRYGVTGYPTLLVLDAGGRELGRIAGFVEPDEFLRRIQGIRKSAGK